MKRSRYSKSAIEAGKVIALGGNLWHREVFAAVRLRERGRSELEAAAHVFFEKVLPELDAFVQQKIEWAKRYGIRLAASVAEDYDALSAHPYRVSDCILGKLNLIPKGRIRRTPKPRKYGG